MTPKPPADELTQLRAKVQELEQANADKNAAIADWAQRYFKQSCDLAASQLEVKRLREALTPLGRCHLPPDGFWNAGVTVYFRSEQVAAAQKALAAHTDTAALDEYVAEKVKGLQVELAYILSGVDQTEIESEHGWWETSGGALFGAAILGRIDRAFAAINQQKEGE